MGLATMHLLGRSAAAVLGATVGAERESAARVQVLERTRWWRSALCCSRWPAPTGFGDIERTANVDPARIAAQVAAGVGFIGAGATIRNGASVT